MKTFECFWGDGYRDLDKKSILAYHDEVFFSVERGYDPIDIERVLSIDIDDVFDLSDIGGEHWVRRIA